MRSGQFKRTVLRNVIYGCWNLASIHWYWIKSWKQNFGWKWSRSVVSDSLQLHGLHSPWNSSGQNTEVGSLSLLQWIFPIQGSNPGLLHCRQILYQLSHQGSPRILEWVAYPFSSGSSWPRNRTRVSSIAGAFFTNWAIREVMDKSREQINLWKMTKWNRTIWII